jgi:hypothetical protein
VSGDLLRRAAAKLREAVNPDYVFVAPWTAVKEVESLDGWTVRDPEGPIADGLPGPEAAYFALVHPPVALALAAWLETHARDMALTKDRLNAVDSPGDTRHAIEVARAVLRESTGDAPGSSDG